MAVTETIIEIYNDEWMEDLFSTVDTEGSGNPVQASHLAYGKHYWARAKAEIDGTDWTEWSVGYPFATYPWATFSETPYADGTSVRSSVETTTTDVGVVGCGVVWSTSSAMTHPHYDGGLQDAWHSVVSGLKQGQTYWFAPFVTDEYGRTYIDNPVSATVGYAVPYITLSGTTAWSDHASGMVTVTSEDELDSISVWLIADGSAVSVIGDLEDMGGWWQWTCEGLNPGTHYTVHVQAVNSGGTGTATATLTTSEWTNSVTLDAAEAYAIDPYGSLYAEATGHADNGVVISNVGVSAFLSDSHSGVPAGQIDGHGADSASGVIEGLLPGTEYYLFAWMEYSTDGETMQKVWSASQSVLTAPTIAWAGMADVGSSTYSGGVVIGGDHYSVTLEYKTSSVVNWLYAAVGDDGTFELTGLSPNTSYDLRAEASNTSGSMAITRSFTTATHQHQVYIDSIVNITDTTAEAEVVYE